MYSNIADRRWDVTDDKLIGPPADYFNIFHLISGPSCHLLVTVQSHFGPLFRSTANGSHVGKCRNRFWVQFGRVYDGPTISRTTSKSVNSTDNG